MEINNIILDIGNVLVSFCWKKYFRSLGFSEKIIKKVAKATVLSPQWDELDKGELSDDMFIELFIKNDPSIEREIKCMYKNFNDIIEVFDYTYSWIEALKSKNLSVYILSNFSHKLYCESNHKLNFINQTDGAILSFQENLIKPDHRIYQLILERYHLQPEHCLFLDDKEINIHAARNNGINGIVFKNYQDALKQLQDYNIYL